MPTRNRLIVLVEDEPDDAFLIERTLVRANALNKVVVLKDGVEALDYLFGRGAHAGRDLKAVPAVVLLDLKMPRLGGFEVLQAMRQDERTKWIPVVVITSSREESDKVKSMNMGANNVLQKAAIFADFTATIQGLGLYWLVLEAPHPEPRGNGEKAS